MDLTGKRDLSRREFFEKGATAFATACAAQTLAFGKARIPIALQL